MLPDVGTCYVQSLFLFGLILVLLDIVGGCDSECGEETWLPGTWTEK